MEDESVIDSISVTSALPAGPVVKICGLTRLEDVLRAARLGAWALGFVFAPSPRRLAPAVARELIVQACARLLQPDPSSDGQGATPLPLTVGVFGDAPAEEIAEVAETAGVDAVQLHGLAGAEGTGATAAAVRTALVGRREVTGRDGAPFIIRAVPVPAEGADLGRLREAVAVAREGADVVLLDSSSAGRFGGTGMSFAWSLAQAAADGGPLLVAGGVTPDNIASALRESGAWGVDVSSGVELSPGVKDPRRLDQLFANAGGAVSARAWPRARAGATAGAGATPSPGAAARARGAHRF